MATGLNGTNGHSFSNNGCADFVYADMDDDGYIDLIRFATISSDSYVEWGTASGFPASVTVNDTVIADDVAGDYYRNVVIGDITGDGVPEFATSAAQGGGSVYVIWGGHAIWGTAGSRPATINLSSIDGTNGTRIKAASASYFFPQRIADVNGDGIGDLLSPAQYYVNGGGDAGGVGIFFGRSNASAWAASYTTLTADSLVLIEGHWNSNDKGIKTIYPAADINGDGILDLLFRGNDSLKFYCVFGKSSWDARLQTSNFTGSATTGFKISPPTATASEAIYGDLNNDGKADLIITDKANASGGKAWVLFGKANGSYSAAMSVTSLDGTNGFIVDGASNASQALGTRFNANADFDGDGFNDLILTAPNADNNAADTGSIYMIFGRSSGWPASISL